MCSLARSVISSRALSRRIDLATTNMYFVRLCRSIVAAPGGRLTGSWSKLSNGALAQRLVELLDSIHVVPMRVLEFSRPPSWPTPTGCRHWVQKRSPCLEQVSGALCVWEGDDGAGIRSAALAAGVTYVAIAR